ncbi:MAG TPA: 16S rRNA (cytosine(1402)-N(4))-methyltransferase RsmH [Candidatus Pacebacteria bacterium]|nr:16S rRNA (cytosine(1402)-N(4))-methyltransferase RsmH [Candidatus Paceibacterota bacterium]
MILSLINRRQNKKFNMALTVHKSVLLNEVIESMNLEEGNIVFDGTLGGGGYSEEILKKIGESGILIGTDLDSAAHKKVNKRLEKYKTQKYFFQKNYSQISEILEELNIEKIDSATLDLGISSDQLEEIQRGISFKNLDNPLDMNLTDNEELKKLTASEILNEWDEESIADIIFYYGDERAAKKIASAVIEKRKTKSFEKVKDLVDLLEDEIGYFYKHKKIHPSTKTFQALRITVNDEMGNLKIALKDVIKSIKKGGKFSVVTFHSLEDRITKKIFKEFEEEGLVKRINKKVIKPSEEELKENPRARSAKLRIVEIL